MNDFLLSPLAERVAWTLIHFLWQGAVVATAYLALRQMNLTRSAHGRYLLSFGALCVMAACPFVTFGLLTSSSASAGFLSAEVTAHAVERPGSLDVVWPVFVLSAWLMGVGLLGTRLLFGYLQLRKWRADVVILPECLRSQVTRLSERIGLGSFRRVYLSTNVTEAMALGFLKPIVLLPVSWVTQMSLSTLEAVIAHELAHIRRFDLWVNLFQRMLETLLFYHPAVWWLSAKVRDERELCCDELAMRVTGENLEYAQALENVAQFLSRDKPLLGTSFTGEKDMKLLKRVKEVLGDSSPGKRSLWWPAGLLALLLPLAFYGSTLLADDEKPPVDRPRSERDDRAEPPPRRDGDRPDAPPRGREGDERRPPREGEGRRPELPPRRGDLPPRRGDRDETHPPRDREREGERDRRPLPPRGGEHDLRREIEELRREVRQLHELLRRQRGEELPPRGDRDRRDPPPREGDRRDPPPREGDRPPPDGDRPSREAERRDPSPREREGDRLPRRDRDDDGPPPRGPSDGEERPRGDRPPREGDREERPRRPEAKKPDVEEKGKTEAKRSREIRRQVVSQTDPPSIKQVLNALAQSDESVPFFEKTSRDNIRIVVEQVSSRVDQPRYFPHLGVAHLHNSTYKCTVSSDKTVASTWPVASTHRERNALEVVYLDQAQLVRTE